MGTTTVMVVEDDQAFLSRFSRIVAQSNELSLLAMRRRGWDCSEVARRCLVGALFIFLVVARAVAVPAAGATTPPVAEITQVEILVGDDSATPPSDSAAWQQAVLPDRWRETRPNMHGTGWYRMQVDLPD